MYIRRIRLHNFRNIDAELTLGPGINVFFGRNGQGKTNVLEGIHVASTGKSFRPGRLADLVRFGADEALVSVSVEEESVESEVTVELRGGARQHLVDGNPTNSLEEVAERLRLVFFGPDDLTLVKGSPSQRRDFLDRAIAVHHPPYQRLLTGYGRLLRERNNLLKEMGGRRSPPMELMESFEEETARVGGVLVEYRLKYLREFIPAAAHFFKEHTGGRLELVVSYSATIELGEEEPEREALSATLLQQLRQRRGADSTAGTTSVGPHLDDLELSVNGRPARYFASQGEQRQVDVSFKLGQLSLWK